jgi:hypothetical protein
VSGTLIPTMSLRFIERSELDHKTCTTRTVRILQQKFRTPRDQDMWLDVPLVITDSWL